MTLSLIPSQINLKNGNLFPADCLLDLALEAEAQPDILVDDIFQLDFYFPGKTVTVDVGWKELTVGGRERGYFWCRALKNQDWNDPLLEALCGDTKTLKAVLVAWIDLIDALPY
jgi:hypothetical protein